MKRIIFILLLLAGFSTSSRAQWYLGGGLSFGTGPQSQLSVNISPEAGYHFSSNFTLGGRLSYVSGYNRFGFDPYARMYILKPDNPVRLAASIHVPVQFAQNVFSYGVYIQPGVSIRASSNVRFECHFGAFGWGASRYQGITTSSWDATINSSNISIGVVCSI